MVWQTFTSHALMILIPLLHTLLYLGQGNHNPLEPLVEISIVVGENNPEPSGFLGAEILSRCKEDLLV